MEDDLPVRYFVMGGGDGRRTPEGQMSHGSAWRTADAWPPSATQEASLYLHADGSLAPEFHAGSPEATTYRTDPRDPVPTLGGNMIRYQNILWPGAMVCYPTSNLFQAGHRIRVDIASSNYPHFDIDPNTDAPLGQGQHTAVAENTVYHSREPSLHVVLPVVLQPKFLCDTMYCIR